MIRVLFKDRMYNPADQRDIDCSFTLTFKTGKSKDSKRRKIEVVKNLLSPAKYEDEVAGEYSYEEWVIETLMREQILFSYEEEVDATIEW